MLRIASGILGCTLLAACSTTSGGDSSLPLPQELDQAPAPTAPVGTTTSPSLLAVQVEQLAPMFHFMPAAARVLLLSVDGLHASDLDRYVASNPTSAMAKLAGRGVKYTQATSSRPSDSFPGTMAMVTGGSPKTTGIFYDVVWDDLLSPPGSDCSTSGTTVTYNQLASFDPTKIDTTLNPANLPRDGANGCAPVYPHSFLKVNTVYEVIHAFGRRTAACDKHASYEILQGPSGTGVDDLYTPEAEANGAKKSIVLTEQNDELKVLAVLNQIYGFDHTGGTHVGVPAILGMNFQAVNIGQKIAGYADAQGTPTPDLAGALGYVDDALTRILAALDDQGLTDTTRVVLTSKSGNSPIDPAARVAIDPAKYNATIDAVAPGLTARVTADTVALVWLTDHSRAAEVAAALQANATALGVETIYTGADLLSAFGGAFASSTNRRPDVIVQPTHGVVYTTATKKADHGGFTDDDIHVPLIVSQPNLIPGVNDVPVDLRQVAPTILYSLGLPAFFLKAVILEQTRVLPGLATHD